MGGGLRPTAKAIESIQSALRARKCLTGSKPSLWADDRRWRDRISEAGDENGALVLTLEHPILRKLDSCGSIRQFEQVQAQMFAHGIFQNSLAYSRVVKKLCAWFGDVNRAVEVFGKLEDPDAFVCNTIMRCFVNAGDAGGGLGFYEREVVGKGGSLVNHFTFPVVVKACAGLMSVRSGMRVHGRVMRLGFDADLFVGNSLIHMYSVCGRIGDARKAFDEMSVRDLVSWNSMVDGLMKNGDVGIAIEVFWEMPERDVFSWNMMIAGCVGVEDMEAAKRVFDEMPVRDVVSWNSMLDGYAKVGNVVAARDLFDRMRRRNVISWNTMLALYVRVKDFGECLQLFDAMNEGDVRPNDATLVSVLTACANLGALHRGKSVHEFIRSNMIETDVLLSTALLTMYSKCGAMDLSEDVFNAMEEKSVVSWNAMIMGYGVHGQGEKALDLFSRMERNGPSPNDATFVCVLSACTHAGMLLEGWCLFERMCQVYNITPKAEHYGCMVDLLGRAGLTNDSEEFLQGMPMDSGPPLWGALLSASKTNSNAKFGELVAKRLIKLKPDDMGAYVFLSNIYAAEGRWDDVDKVRTMMKERGSHKAAVSALVG
uniref:Chlororespiratory reduction 4 n=1 Tax=Kalanchoe fedtschenkoi TaxID=63787 RepID=A0A7N0SYN2_KALFE